MPALNFGAQFAPLVKLGHKRQTIRRLRKRAIRVGDKLYFYTGLRTKQCRKLGEGICSDVVAIRFVPRKTMTPMVYMNGLMLDWAQIESLAQEDGFTAPAHFDFFDFFCGPLWNKPFSGQVIRW